MTTIALRRAAPCVLAAAMLPSLLLALPQFAKRKPETSRISSFGAAELVSSGENPVVRYPVAHQHGFSGCYGYLYFSRTSVRFKTLDSESQKEHEFDRPLSQINSLTSKVQRGTSFTRAEFKFSGGGTFNFFNIGRAGQTIDRKEVLPAQHLVDAVNHFEDLVAMLQAREERARPAQPPTIAILDPTGAEEGKAVETSRSLRVRGLASHANGIASVTVNGHPAFLKPMTPQTVEFDARDLPINAGSNAVVVLATATDKTMVRLNFQVAKAEIRLLGPLPGYESPEPVVNVRGRISGFGEIQSVELAGVRARLSPQGDGTTEFEAAKVPLRELGTNTLEGVVVAANGTREPFQFEVRRKQLQPPILSITSKPGAVQVYVDDEPRGTTSAGGKLVLRDLPVGSHRVRLSLSGYQDWEQTVDLVAGGDHNVQANLSLSGPPPFTLQDVVDMLQGDISARRVGSLVQERGVDFALTDEAEEKIRAAGGDSDLLLAVAKAKR